MYNLVQLVDIGIRKLLYLPSHADLSDARV